MEEILKDACFGKKFQTRDGRMAIYHYKQDNPTGDGKYDAWHFLIIPGEKSHIICLSDGKSVGATTEWSEDIVSRWKETKAISDEEKALEISRGQASETDYVTTAAYNGAMEMSYWKNEQYIETAGEHAKFYREGVAKANPDLSEPILNLVETAYIAGRNMLLLK